MRARKQQVLIRVTREDVNKHAQEMDIPDGSITDEVFSLVKKGIESGMFSWGPRELKSAIKDAIWWALKSA